MELVWNAEKVSKRFLSLIDNKLLTDVCFYVGPEREKIEAHKIILASGSPVFHSMFFGGLASTSDEIEIPEDCPTSFKAIIRYIYGDELPSPSSALSVLYAANKYLLPSFAKECRKLLKENITPNNVLDIYIEAIIHHEEDVADICWYIICENTLQVSKSPRFIYIDKELLIKIVQCSNLNIPEINLYESVMNWGKQLCMENLLEVTNENIRSMIEDLINLLRFPLMTEKEFANGPGKSGILTEKESYEMFLYYLSDQKPTPKYSSIPRLYKPLSLLGNAFLTSTIHSSAILGMRFQTDTKLILIGISTSIHGFGPQEEFNLQMRNETTGETEIFTMKFDPPYWSSKKIIPILDAFQYVVKLSQPQIILPNNIYVLKLHLRGISECKNENFPPFQTFSRLNINIWISVMTGECEQSHTDSTENQNRTQFQFSIPTFVSTTFYGTSTGETTTSFKVRPPLELTGLIFHNVNEI